MFKNEMEYLRWCERMVNKIKYRTISLGNQRIKEVIMEIDSTLHVSEGDRLIGNEEDD